MNNTTDVLRNDLAGNAKTFKTSWIFLGQALYTVWRDKLYYAWGFEKFEDYVTDELGMKKALGMKLVKTYFFVEQQEPGYLQKEFSEGREAAIIPSYEPLDVLRMARTNKDINREDYQKLREQVFVKGKDAVELRKDLTAMIKERKQVDPDEAREARHQASIKRLVNALRVFQKDDESLKLTDVRVVEVVGILLEEVNKKYA